LGTLLISPEPRFSCLSFECVSFDHASHVVMSVIKLMSRIVAPSQLEDLIEGSGGCSAKHAALMKLHDHTYEFPVLPPIPFYLLD